MTCCTVCVQHWCSRLPDRGSRLRAAHGVRVLCEERPRRSHSWLCAAGVGVRGGFEFWPRLCVFCAVCPDAVCSVPVVVARGCLHKLWCVRPGQHQGCQAAGRVDLVHAAPTGNSGMVLLWCLQSRLGVFGKVVVWGDREGVYQLGLEGRAGTCCLDQPNCVGRVRWGPCLPL